MAALLSPEPSSTTEESHLVATDLIEPNPLQPRMHFDEAKLAELAQSIEANGLVQPLLVRRKGAAFQLIAGERRWRAAQLAGLRKVSVVIRDVPDEQLLELALIENIQREDLNPIEEAGAYQRLISSVGMTQEVLAKRVGRDRSYITNYLRLLRLPDDLKKMVQTGGLSTGHARTLLAIEDEEVQREVAKKIVSEQLSVRATERLVQGRAEASAKRSKETPAQVVDPNVIAAESKLRRRLGTKVRILQNAQTKAGKIEIEFYNGKDLSRLYDLLVAPTTYAARDMG